MKFFILLPLYSTEISEFELVEPEDDPMPIPIPPPPPVPVASLYSACTESAIFYLSSVSDTFLLKVTIISHPLACPIT